LIKRIKREDITCEIENPQLLINNSNLSKAVIELFCKELRNEQIDVLISMITNIHEEESNSN
jgi:hypothetical protein